MAGTTASKVTPEDLISAAKLHVAETLKTSVTDDKERAAIQDKVASIFTTAIKAEVKGDNHLTKEDAHTLAADIADMVKAKGATLNAADEKAILAQTTEDMVYAIKGRVTEAAAETLAKAEAADAAFNGSKYKASVDSATNAEHGVINEKHALDIAREETAATSANAAKAAKDAEELESLRKAVGQPKLDEINTQTKGLVNHAELSDAITLRAKHAELHTAHAKIKADGGTPDKAALEAYEAAKKAADEKAGAYKKTFETARNAHTGDAQKAFDRSFHGALDEHRAADATKALHETHAANMAAGVEHGLGDVGSMLGKDRLAKSGIITEVTKKLGEATAAVSGSGKWMGSRGAMAVGGAVLVGGAIKAAMSDKPVDPQTNEKPKMSFMAGAATALAAVVGAVLIVGAVRNGNPVEGFKEGKGVVGKFTAMVQSTTSTGAYAGRS